MWYEYVSNQETCITISCLYINNLNSYFLDIMTNLMTYWFASLQVLVNDKTASASEIVSSSIS